MNKANYFNKLPLDQRNYGIFGNVNWFDRRDAIEAWDSISLLHTSIVLNNFYLFNKAISLIGNIAKMRCSQSMVQGKNNLVDDGEHL
jgi:hypothetical protein